MSPHSHPTQLGDHRAAAIVEGGVLEQAQEVGLASREPVT